MPHTYTPSQLIKTPKMELPVYLLSSLILILSTITFFFIKNRKLPPGPNGLPLLGSLITIGDRPHQSLAKLSKTYGPLMTVKLGLVNVVVASSAEMAKEILQKHDQSFLGRPIPHAITAEKGYELSMGWLSGRSPEWKKLRRICTSQIFTMQRLDALQELRHQCIKNMVDRVAEARESGEGVLIGSLVFGTILNMLSNTMFSLDVLDVRSDAVKELKFLIGRIFELVGKPNFADYFPFLKPFDPQGIKRETKVPYDRMHELVGEIIERRKKRRRDDSSKNGDFLDVLLDCSEGDGPEKLDQMNVKLMLMDLLIGGTDTTTTTIEWAMAELLHNPTILSKAKQELSHKIPTGKAIQEDDIANLPYLEAIIKETMRVHPTVPLLLPHLAEEDVQINQYVIRENTQIFINVWSILRDNAYWNEPTVFKPERFLNTEIDFRGRDFSFTPFGAGRRMCPGLNLGVRMMSLVVATLVHNFDWKLVDGMVPEEMDMADKFGVTLQKAVPLVIIPLKRVN